MKALVRAFTSNTKEFSPPWRILFFGTDRFAVHPLEALFADHQRSSGSIVKGISVVCPPERRRVIKKSPISGMIATARDFALQNELPIHEWQGKHGWSPTSWPEGIYDIGVVASFGHLIPDNVLNMFEHGAINLHPSLLPALRGAAPMTQALLNGQSETGVTLVEVSRDKFDMGAVLMQKKYQIAKNMTYDELSEELAKLGTKMLMYALRNMKELRQNAFQQSKTGASWTSRITKEMGYIDWECHSCEHIRRRWSALSSRVGVHTSWDGKKVRLIKMTQEPFNAGKTDMYSHPGHVRFDKERGILFIRAKDGWVGFTDLQVECKSVTTAKDFANAHLLQKSCTREKLNTRLAFDNLHYVE